MLNINNKLNVIGIMCLFVFGIISYSFANNIIYNSSLSFDNTKRVNDLDSMNCEIFTADKTNGNIGFSEYENIDIPEDNIFKFDINYDTKVDDKVWLEFELYGVTDNSSVSIIVNDNTSFGGYVISEDKTWKKQRILLDPRWMNEGINRIQFSKLSKSSISYTVKNIKIGIEKRAALENTIVFYDDATEYPCYNGKAYIRGFVHSPNKEIQKIEVNGEEAFVNKSMFELIYHTTKMGESKTETVLLTVHFTDGSMSTKDIVLKDMDANEVDVIEGIEKIYSSSYFMKANTEFEINEKDFSFMVSNKSLVSDLNLSVTRLRNVDLPPMNLDLTNVTGKTAGYRMLPHGYHFSEEGVVLRLSYDKNSIPKGYSEADIQTYYFDIEKSKWLSLKRDSIDTKNGYIYSHVEHFTDYINGVISSPESTESTSFTSTYFNDLLKSNPMSGITLISPPSASPTGEASTSYPIEVPPGRNGLQPNLAVTYSSDGGSSWIGYGWNLSIPSIDIETRWGVPRYDDMKESEAYLVAGEQLVTLDDNDDPYLPHRSASFIDRVADREFYKRVESPSGFSEFIRHGDSPTNYWWEVIDRNGTKYYYGSTDGTDFNTAYVIQTSSDNIAKWLLTKVIDTYGNYMLYTYTKTTVSAVSGISVYPQKIKYTLNNNVAFGGTSNYSLEFKLDATDRLDSRTDARTGVMIVDNKRLEEILVSGPSGKIRSYKLVVMEGEFKKSLLKTLTCKGSSGGTLYSHTFDYHNDLGSGSFTSEESWDTGDPNDVEQMNLLFPSGDKKFSSLGGGSAGANGASLYVGVGTASPQGGKSGTVGGNFGYTVSDSRGIVQFLDINGDGLPDKVYRSANGGIKYNKNISRIDNSNFAMFQNGSINNNVFEQNPFNISENNNSAIEFSLSEDKSFSFGISYHPPLLPPQSATIGVSKQFSHSKISSYLNDINGDGFVDVVYDDKVYFNTLKPNNSAGDIVFNSSLYSSICPLVTPGSSAFNNLYVISPSEQTDFYDKHPRLDVVKVWVAPRTGRVKVPPTVVTNISSGQSTNEDGVIVEIQHKENVVYDNLSAPIHPGFNLTVPPSSESLEIDVDEGDKIYFRAMSGASFDANGEDDEIEWDVELNYISTTGIVDVYGQNNDDFKFSNDVIPSKTGGILIHENNTTVTFKATVIVDKDISDKVYFQIWNGDNLVKSIDCGNSQNTVGVNINETITTINDDEVFYLRLESNSNIDWLAVSVVDREVSDNANINLFDDEVAVEYWFYKEVEDAGNIDYENTLQMVIPELVVPIGLVNPYSMLVHDNGQTINLTDANGNQIESITGRIMVSVKSDIQTFFQQEWDVNVDNSGNVNMSPSTIVINEPITDANVKIYSTINYLEFEGMVGQDLNPIPASQIINTTLWRIANVDLVLNSDNTKIQQLYATHYIYEAQERAIFNSLYRGWGVFVYNPDGLDFDLNPLPTDKILESALNFGKYEVDASGNPTGPEFYNKAHFPMNWNQENGNDYWNIFEKENTVATLTGFTPSRLIEDNANLSLPLSNPVQGSYPGITMETKSESNSINAGVSYGLDLSLTVSSTGESTNTIEYLDLNGDKIPDVIGNNSSIAYTNPNGDLIQKNVSPGPSRSINNIIPVGISLGGSYAFSTSSRSASQENKQVATCSLTGNYSKNISYSSSFWLDINGDGLPDKIESENVVNPSGYITGRRYSVQYNLGYDFSAKVDLFDGSFMPNSISESNGMGVGFSISNGSFSGGLGYNKTLADGKSSFTDINGDGLPDYLSVNGSNLEVMLNTGSSFVGYTGYDMTQLGDDINKTQSNGESANVAFTFFFNVFGLSFAVTPGLNTSSSMNRTEVTFADIDGDGYVDFLTSKPEKEFNILTNQFPEFENSNIIKVRRSKIGKTNKLKSVSNSIGGSFTLDYALTPATIKHPGGKYVMTKVEVKDGHAENGPDYVTEFEYDDGYYDRCERTFLGFSKVNTIQEDGQGTALRTTANVYKNDNIYQKSLLDATKLIDGGYSGTVAKTTDNTYSARTVIPEANNSFTSGNPPADLSTEKEAIVNTMLTATQTELNINNNIGESSSMVYDDYGNITSYTYNNGSGGYTTIIGYFQNTSKNILGIANSLTIAGLREKTADINDNGRITKLTVNNGTNSSVTDYTYFDNGNIESITLPESGGRKSYSYTYEGTLETHIETVTDNFGFVSQNLMYDYRYGVPKEVVDINNNSTTFSYDEYGRLKNFVSPFGYGAQFTYDLNNLPISATTERFDPETNGDLKSVIYADGLGRALQTIAQASIKGVPKTIVSGVPYYDELGRTTKSYYPTVGDNYNYTSSSTGKESVFDYDILDRKIQEILPGERKTKYTYSASGNNLQTTVIDAVGNIPNGNPAEHTSISISEYNGPVVSQSTNMGFTSIFEYDDINQLIKIKHPNTKETTFSYDMAGRMTNRVSPDAGTTSFEYDALGNITKKSNKWDITYGYEYGRLKSINYGEHGGLKVEYVYDGSTPNCNGRLFQIKDGTGSQRFSYGVMGEVTKIERSIAIPYKTDAAEFVTQWEYDLWNRVQKMTYPDGEEVDFEYDSGGNLKGISGLKNGNSYTYVNDIQYDEFGSRTKLIYGNGVETTYTYKPEERWPQTMVATFGSGALNVEYKDYDKMGNLEVLKKNTKEQLFSYDDDYRLTNSSGEWSGSFLFPNANCITGGFEADYSSNYTYDNMGNFTKKENNINRYDPVYTSLSKGYKLNYSYSGNNQIKNIEEIYHSSDINSMNRKSLHTYNYDDNGNIVGVKQELKDKANNHSDTELEIKRGIVWQEGDLMRALSDDNTVTHFVYDANGERVLKLSEQYHRIFVNGELSGGGYETEIGYTMYVNPYMTVRQDGHYTKHFYIGTERVVSKIGVSDGYGVDPTQLGLGLANGKRGVLEALMGKNNNDLGVDLDFNSGGSSPDLGLSSGNNDVETDRYFFTKDHIGSSSVITDATGKPIQQIEYMPFGESYVDWRELSWNTPYRFTGKEQDAETGLYYYGARYYDPKVGRFMSVDPLADKYPGINPYAYVANNPVRLVDPTGMGAEESEWVPDKNTGNLIAESGDNAESLAKNWGYSETEAQNFIDKSKVKLGAEGNVKKGEVVQVSNRFTKLASSQSTDNIGRFQTQGEVQNCHGVTCNNGGYHNGGNVDEYGGMDVDLRKFYTPVSESDAIPLETVVRWGGHNPHVSKSTNFNNHTATVYGFSKNGTTYMATVNGFGAKLQFVPLSNVRQYFEPQTLKARETNNNKIQGINHGDSGYYNLK